MVVVLLRCFGGSPRLQCSASTYPMVQHQGQDGTFLAQSGVLLLVHPSMRRWVRLFFQWLHQRATVVLLVRCIVLLVHTYGRRCNRAGLLIVAPVVGSIEAGSSWCTPLVHGHFWTSMRAPVCHCGAAQFLLVQPSQHLSDRLALEDFQWHRYAAAVLCS